MAEPRKHRNFHLVGAKDNFELGFLLGKKFGQALRQSIARGKNKFARADLEKARRCLAATRRHFPQYVKELEGYARGAGVDFADLWAISLEDELDRPERCTFVVTNDGKLVLHNEDWTKNAENSICLLQKTIGRLTILEIFYYHTLGGCAASVNSQGYFQSINTLTHTDRQIGVPRNVIARWLSETANPERDFQRLKTIKRSAGYNHNIVSAQGRIWNIECTAKKQILVKPASPFVHANHYLTSPLAKLENNNSTGSRQRYLAARQKTKPKMSLAGLQKLASDTSQGKTASILNEKTIGRMIVDFDQKIARAWLRREENKEWIDYRLDFLSP